MKHVMVRYRVKPGRVEENEELVRAVYEELRRTQPADMRYSTHSLDDGRTFIHLHEGESAGLTELAAFREFLRSIRERCEEPPVVSELTEVGSYRPTQGS
jgi:hypothetical protein